MSEILENFEAKAKFQDESDAELIRDKLETLINNILADVGKRDPRFQNTLVKSGSVYEETKVCQPNEFDFMVKITPLTDKPLISQSSCAKNDGYATCSYFSRKITGKTSEIEKVASAHTCFPDTSKNSSWNQ